MNKSGMVALKINSYITRNNDRITIFEKFILPKVGVYLHDNKIPSFLSKTPKGTFKLYKTKSSCKNNTNVLKTSKYVNNSYIAFNHYHNTYDYRYIRYFSSKKDNYKSSGCVKLRDTTYNYRKKTNGYSNNSMKLTLK